MSILRQIMLIVSILFLGGAAEAGNLALCSDGVGWSSATSVWTRSDDTDTSIRIQRYSDGVRIDIHGPGEEKSLIMLETGERMFRGAASGIEDFAFADIAAGAPVQYLQRGFPTPCAARLATAFHLAMNEGDRSSGGLGSVAGTILADDDSLHYTLDFQSDGAPHPGRRLHGKWSVAALVPIPPATGIDGWSLQPNDAGATEEIQATTIRDFRERERSRASDLRSVGAR